MKSIVLIDGEHYPPVVARAIQQLLSDGEEPVLALMMGGKEKLGQAAVDLGLPVETAGADGEASLAAAIDRTGATLVIDISDEPVLGYEQRCRLACVASWKGARYKGADFQFTPPSRSRDPLRPSVAVFGTGKRTGKTAISGALARLARDEGLDPVVVAMGRGGPSDPQVLEGAAKLSPGGLLDLSQAGGHAASDYIEDALTAEVPSVGAWRAGGGLLGATGFSNYGAALLAAEGLGPGMLILEGSGSAIPPAEAHAGVLIVDARIDPQHLCGYFGLYRVLLADLVVLTMSEKTVGKAHLSRLEECIGGCSLNRPAVVRTVFRPFPLGDIAGKKVWLATTASEQAGGILVRHLRDHFDADVVGISHALSDRRRLRDDLSTIRGDNTLVVELKAAAVDVVTQYAIDNDMEVVYMDNRPEPAEGAEESLPSEFLRVTRLAGERFAGVGLEGQNTD